MNIRLYKKSFIQQNGQKLPGIPKKQFYHDDQTKEVNFFSAYLMKNFFREFAFSLITF